MRNGIFFALLAAIALVSSEPLSRKRRYLSFPEGSSFQLVFCFTYPSIAIGDIFIFGNTAAIAWELPTKSIFLDKKRPPSGDDAQAATTTTEAASTEAQHRYDFFSRYPSDPFYRPSERRPVYVEPKYHDIYRRTRRQLYGKIEQFFATLGLDGGACLLRTICEVGSMSREKGSFFEEMAKIVFGVKPHGDYPDEDRYDAATARDCRRAFRTCDDSPLFRMLASVND